MAAALLSVAVIMPIVNAQEHVCSEHTATATHALLQRGMARAGAAAPLNEAWPQQVLSNLDLETNPSGAAAPLNEEGYSAVADRCCLAEMKVFIERVIFDHGLQICEQPGLEGFVPWHSCGSTSSYAGLVEHLVQDSRGQCPWVQAADAACQALPGPPTCEEFPGVTPHPPCSCSRSKAAIVDLAAASLSRNNLDGKGPGAAEMRFSGSPGAGVITSTGQVFDIVITTVDAYSPGAPNSKRGDFGKIIISGRSSTTFKFSFVEPGSNSPVKVPEIHMAVFDLDRWNRWSVETTSSKGYTGYVTDPHPDLVASKLPDGRTEFTGTKSGSDPTTAMTLTDAQKKSSIMFFYTDVTSFELNFAKKGSGDSGLLFAFGSSLQERCGD